MSKLSHTVLPTTGSELPYVWFMVYNATLNNISVI